MTSVKKTSTKEKEQKKKGVRQDKKLEIWYLLRQLKPVLNSNSTFKQTKLIL